MNGQLSGKDGRSHVSAACEFLVEHVETHAVVADKCELIDKLTGIVFFLHLLVDEPCKTVAGGVVMLCFGEAEQRVDEGGYLLLVGQSSLESVEGRFPGGGNGIDGLELHAAAALVDIVHEYGGVGLFFLKLDFEPVGNARAAFGLEVHAH